MRQGVANVIKRDREQVSPPRGRRLRPAATIPARADRAYGRGHLQIPAHLTAVSPWSAEFSFLPQENWASLRLFPYLRLGGRPCRQTTSGLRGAGLP